MPVTIRIPTYLASFAGGRNQLAVSGSPATVSEALTALWKEYPGLRDRIVDEQGAVRQHINIYTNFNAMRDSAPNLCHYSGWIILRSGSAPTQASKCARDPGPAS